MQLINTIEISPYAFSREAYDFPNGSSLELPEEWNQFWKKCISDKNLGHLESIRKGSYLVDIRTLRDDDLVEILKNELKEVELLDFEEQVGKINGGIVLMDNNEIYIEPTCCGDIGNMKEWEKISQHASNQWNELWIGHPWIFYRKDNQFIEFSNYTESNPKDFNENEILVRVSQSELQTEFKKIVEQQNDFEFRIRKTLDRMGIAHAEQISKLMTGHA
ncbi:hypothetical protein [Parachryseolinea silvisoli]|jgi:hypothetical protein|uniref:hypothetical protein n=1 Tax=Parachryseolinea silvisoli TaxID=2873601 RepID=UPI0022659D8D|nr:hypothetical protein [Parachryseolinea silvisoli]MCD9014467.1 hypothetical protein [Parachryseolinea silvisoli]